MNILFATSTFPYAKNCSQAPFVWEQASAWSQAQPQDNIYILAPHHKEAKKNEVNNTINIHRFQYWWPTQFETLAYPAILPNVKRNPFLIFQIPFFLISEFFAMLKMVRRHDINLIYAHWIMPQGLVSLLVSKLTNVPYVLNNHSSDLKIFEKIPFLGKMIARNILKNSRKNFCVNSILQDEILKIYPEAQKKTIVLPMGVKQNNLMNTENKFEYDIGFIGRLSEKKGISCLFKALTEISSIQPNITVAIAGDGEIYDSLLKQSLEIPNIKIKFLGFINDHEKFDFFSKTRILVFPSINWKGDVEGLPVALLEALAFGKTTMASSATNIKTIPEWDALKEDITFLNDPQNTNEFSTKLIKLLQNSSFESKSKQQSIVAKYLWPNLINTYINEIK